MPGSVIARELDCPGNSGHSSDKLSVDEVGNPAKRKGKACRDDDEISKSQVIKVSFSAEEPACEKGACQAAMKT